MNLGFLRSRHSRRITNWKLGSCQTAAARRTAEACRMEQSNCPCIKEEICSGVYWVTSKCAQGVKEGFRPRVAYKQACVKCPNQTVTQESSASRA